MAIDSSSESPVQGQSRRQIENCALSLGEWLLTNKKIADDQIPKFSSEETCHGVIHSIYDRFRVIVKGRIQQNRNVSYFPKCVKELPKKQIRLSRDSMNPSCIVNVSDRPEYRRIFFSHFHSNSHEGKVVLRRR
jgi:hypothetical protein